MIWYYMSASFPTIESIFALQGKEDVPRIDFSHERLEERNQEALLQYNGPSYRQSPFSTSIAPSVSSDWPR